MCFGAGMETLEERRVRVVDSWLATLKVRADELRENVGRDWKHDDESLHIWLDDELSPQLARLQLLVDALVCLTA